MMRHMCASVASSLEASNQEEFVGPRETSWSYELENKGDGFYTKAFADSASGALGGCVFDEDDTHEANCANVVNVNEFAHHWAEDCDSFSYEGLKPKNFMEESPLVDRGQCHRVGSGRPHRESKEDGHH